MSTALTHLQYAVLRMIWNSPAPIRPKQIGVSLDFGIDNATQLIRRSLNTLCAEGLIKRTATNKRCVYYSKASRVFPNVQLLAPEHTFGPKRKTRNIDKFLSTLTGVAAAASKTMEIEHGRTGNRTGPEPSGDAEPDHQL